MASNNYTNTISKSLKIIHINVNSIISISRRYDLQEFLRKHNPDIVLLNETKLNPRHNLKFVNYNVVRHDRNGAIRGGGTAILIRNNIKYKVHTNYNMHSFVTSTSLFIRIQNMYIYKVFTGFCRNYKRNYKPISIPFTPVVKNIAKMPNI